jgi:hypothetical protein
MSRKIWRNIIPPPPGQEEKEAEHSPEMFNPLYKITQYCIQEVHK